MSKIFKYVWDMHPSKCAILHNIQVTAITFDITACGNLIQTLYFYEPIYANKAIDVAEKWLSIPIKPEELDDIRQFTTDVYYNEVQYRGDVLKHRRRIVGFKYNPVIYSLELICDIIMM